MGRDARSRRSGRIYGSAKGGGTNCRRANCRRARKSGYARSDRKMSSGTSPIAKAKDPAEHWHALLRPQVAGSRKFTEHFYNRLRTEKLTFGNRVHCPFLRPFFLSPEDETRVRAVAEKMAELAERVAAAALDDEALFNQFHLREGEERLVRMVTGFGPASTASRLDAFLLPDSLKFAEYNGESPAGSGYTETLSEIFRELPVMNEFAKSFEIHSYPLSAKLLDVLIASYLAWVGTTKLPKMLIVFWPALTSLTEFLTLRLL